MEILQVVYQDFLCTIFITSSYRFSLSTSLSKPPCVSTLSNVYWIRISSTIKDIYIYIYIYVIINQVLRIIQIVIKSDVKTGHI